MATVEKRVKRLEVLVWFALAVLLVIGARGCLNDLARSIQEMPPRATWDGGDVSIFVMDGYSRPFVVTHLVARVPGAEPISAQVTRVPIRAESGRYTIRGADLRWLNAEGDPVAAPKPGTSLSVVYVLANVEPDFRP